MAAKDKDPFEDFAKFIWGNRLEGLPIPGFDPGREVTPEELRYMQQKYAFAQIMNPEGLGQFSKSRLVRTQPGWPILDYGNAMCTSPGELLFTDELYSGAGPLAKRVNSGSGTRVKQIIDTASEMVQMVITRKKKEENWPAIQIVSGESLMSWGIWKAATDLKVPLIGYEPSPEEQEKYKRIKANCPTLLIQMTPSARAR